MRSRPAPNPAEYAIDRRALANDTQVKVWLQRLNNSNSPKSVVKSDLAFVLREVAKRRPADFRADLLLDALKATCPVLAYPEMTDPVEDLGYIFAQPEMVKFWARTAGEKREKGPAPAFGWTKAMLAVLAMTGTSTHGRDAYSLLANMPELQTLFAATDARAQGLDPDEVGLDVASPENWEQLPSYATLMRNVSRLTQTIRTEGIAANIEMLKELKIRYPQVGRRLLIDGKAIAAWVPQRSAKAGSSHEEYLRRKLPEAGFRMYTHSSTGKRAFDQKDISKNGRGIERVRAWRGYYLVTLLDQATGLPVVWTMFNCAEDEAKAIVPLLSELFKLWPDLDVEMIAGDSAWDEDPWCELLERHYGIHPIFRLHPSHGERQFSDEHKKIVDGKFLSLSKDGRPRCTHNQFLSYETAEVPSRDGLRPGKAHPNEKAFRVRFSCKHGKQPHGRPGLPMFVDWSRLTYYPHHPDGHPDRYAMRDAMLHRLNQIESHHNHLEAGLSVGTEGGDRSRLGDLDKQEALATLAAVATTAFVLADQRLKDTQLQPAGPRLPPPPRPRRPSSDGPPVDMNEMEAAAADVASLCAPRGRRTGDADRSRGGVAGGPPSKGPGTVSQRPPARQFTLSPTQSDSRIKLRVGKSSKTTSSVLRITEAV